MDELLVAEYENHRLVTLPRDMTLKEILTEYPIPIDYDSCVVYLSYKGPNVASNGTRTRWGYIFYIVDGSPKYMVSPYVNNLLSGDAVSSNGGLTWTANNGSYFAVIDGKISPSSLTGNNDYFAEGNTMDYVCLPYNLFTGMFEI